MKIAIDIDKTIFNCNTVLYKLINTYLINQDLNKKLKYKVVDLDEYSLYINKIIKFFSKMHNPDFYVIEKEASDTIKKWIDKGDEIILLSSRPSAKSLVGALLICLKKYEVPFTQVVVSCNNKASYCKKENIDVLIDDSHYICNNAKQIGIESIWYIAKYNNQPEKKPSIDYLKTAKSWKEIDEQLEERRKKKCSKIR